jgi:hypothetical protein
MANYSVHAFCNECFEVHPLGIIINMNDGPVKKESINDTFAGKEIPSNFQFVNNMFRCPKTKKMTSQKDNDHVFLVPVSD